MHKEGLVQNGSGLLPTVEQVKEKCEKDINGFLGNNTENELQHYRVAHRRSFEYVKRFFSNKRLYEITFEDSKGKKGIAYIEGNDEDDAYNYFYKLYQEKNGAWLKIAWLKAF